VPIEQPLARFRVRVAARRKRSVLVCGSASARLTLLSSPSAWLFQSDGVCWLFLTARRIAMRAPPPTLS